MAEFFLVKTYIISHIEFYLIKKKLVYSHLYTPLNNKIIKIWIVGQIFHTYKVANVMKYIVQTTLCIIDSTKYK